MQNTTQTYKERLTPSLWLLVSAAVVAPMVALTLTPVDTTLALALGIVVAAMFISALILASPVIRVTGTELRAGRAHIDVMHLGLPEDLTGPDAAQARGPGLNHASWHLIRGGIDGVVRVAITDPDDPAPFWVLSSRTPDRLAAAIRRAQLVGDSGAAVAADRSEV